VTGSGGVPAGSLLRRARLGALQLGVTVKGRLVRGGVGRLAVPRRRRVEPVPQRALVGGRVVPGAGGQRPAQVGGLRGGGYQGSGESGDDEGADGEGRCRWHPVGFEVLQRVAEAGGEMQHCSLINVRGVAGAGHHRLGFGQPWRAGARVPAPSLCDEGGDGTQLGAGAKSPLFLLLLAALAPRHGGAEAGAGRHPAAFDGRSPALAAPRPPRFAPQVLGLLRLLGPRREGGRWLQKIPQAGEVPPEGMAGGLQPLAAVGVEVAGEDGGHRSPVPRAGLAVPPAGGCAGHRSHLAPDARSWILSSRQLRAPPLSRVGAGGRPWGLSAGAFVAGQGLGLAHLSQQLLLGQRRHDGVVAFGAEAGEKALVGFGVGPAGAGTPP